MNAIDKIAKELEGMFTELDAKVLADAQAWAKGRVAAIKEFKNSEEWKTLDTWTKYPKVFAIAGGKTWYNAFEGRNAQMIEELMEKNHKATIKARNAKIAAKLTKAGVTELLTSETGWTRDGFNGAFLVNTDAGQKRVKIETIYAGGYNIQCLHLRVLVHVK